MSTPTKNTYRTVVIGAGPAGVMAALAASRSGDVLLVDAATFPRRKSCGGMLNRETLEFLGQIEPVPRALSADPGSVTFRYLDWVRGRTRQTSLEFTNTERVDFDEWLVSLLPDEVEVVDGCPVCALDTTGPGVRLTLGNDSGNTQIEASFVVGCDGARSTARRQLGRGTQEVYVTVQDRVELTGACDSCFDCIAIPGIGGGHAYTYVVPKGETALVGSVFYPHTKHPGNLQDAVLDAVRERRPEIGESQGREGGAALAVRAGSDVVRGKGPMLLAGEAAGFISPTSGEGISYALRSGHLAGLAVAESVNGEALERYRVATGSLAADVRRRLRWLPLMESRAGRYLAGLTPVAVIDRVTQGL